MDYIELLQQNLKNQSQENNILGLIDVEIDRLSEKIIALNLQQIDNSEGFNDSELSSNKFKGVYSKATSAMAFREGKFKPSGGLYDFDWTGSFRKGFNVKNNPKGYSITSFGAYGDSGKEAFFQSYQNMFGLNTENTKTIEDEVLYYVMDKILSKMYA